MDVAGHKMHLYCTGRGTPTEILESGLWSDSVVWYKVQPEIAKLTRVCSYDRAGLGYSDVWLSFFILFLVHVTGVLFSCSFSSPSCFGLERLGTRGILPCWRFRVLLNTGTMPFKPLTRTPIIAGADWPSRRSRKRRDFRKKRKRIFASSTKSLRPMPTTR